MTFRVGMKVVCINDQFDAYTLQAAIALPTRGEVYTIRGHSEGMSAEGVWKAGVLLRELHNPNAMSGSEHCFNPLRFRPAVSPKSETSFTQRAPKDSEKWDNRRKIPVRVREKVGSEETHRTKQSPRQNICRTY